MSSDLQSRVTGLRSKITATIAAGVTGPAAPRSPRLRRGRLDLVFAADVLTAIICWAVTWGVLVTQNTHHHSPHNPWVMFLLAVALCAPLVLRTAYPLTAWSASVLAMFWASLVVQSYSPSGALYIPAAVVVYVLCLYAVAVRCRPWVVTVAALVTVLAATSVVAQPAATSVIVAVLPVSIGVIVRIRRGNRKVLAVAERRHEGERALLEERQRIARELHDVVAHHMSVIAIQAEAGPYKMASPPPELVESFVEIRASALSGLSELRRVLGVLRSDQPDTAPQPGLEDLPGLLDSARAGGVTVTTEVAGTPRPVPDGVDLSAYRIVQEALSNAMRHAPGSTVQVRLFYGEAALIMEIRNDRCGNGAAPADPAATGPERWDGLVGGGHGIIGMRERASMLGGHLDARPVANHEFLVTAALPLGDGGEEEDEETT
ncbi:MAG TPA: sensor histidine kinase [Streptosporangiaceae bacterium]|nr:sensor histidine kinase [Streptosporangiaceae bacterium]